MLVREFHSPLIQKQQQAIQFIQVVDNDEADYKEFCINKLISFLMDDNPQHDKSFLDKFLKERLRNTQNGSAFIIALDSNQNILAYSLETKSLEDYQQLLNSKLSKLKDYSYHYIYLKALLTEKLIQLEHQDFKTKSRSSIYLGGGIQVSSKARKQGLGTLFMKLIIDEARQAGGDLLIAGHDLSNLASGKIQDKLDFLPTLENRTQDFTIDISNTDPFVLRYIAL
ncbi:MAG: GNAT family N-acetyltransferase [Candidatus Melainabacteria bacterium]|jgi:hypothetical protein|nr:GNAT family N-acetyltransferase [Candidatus Melainabacteria bacterium]